MAIVRLQTPDIDLARRRLKAGQHNIKQAIGKRGVELIQESFDIRSRGGRSVGITWQALSPKYLDWKRRKGFSQLIGIREGIMLKSLSYNILGGKIHLGFNVKSQVEYTTFFDTQPPNNPRRLLPDRLPSEWKKELEKAAIERMVKIVGGKLIRKKT